MFKMLLLLSCCTVVQKQCAERNEGKEINSCLSYVDCNSLCLDSVPVTPDSVSQSDTQAENEDENENENEPVAVTATSSITETHRQHSMFRFLHFLTIP